MLTILICLDSCEEDRIDERNKDPYLGNTEFPEMCRMYKHLSAEGIVACPMPHLHASIMAVTCHGCLRLLIVLHGVLSYAYACRIACGQSQAEPDNHACRAVTHRHDVQYIWAHHASRVRHCSPRITDLLSTKDTHGGALLDAS
jgi:hypothetical protein